MEIWYSGFDNVKYSNWLLDLVTKGFSVDGIVINAYKWYATRKRKYDVWKELHDNGVKIIITAINYKDTPKFREYYSKLANEDWVNYVIVDDNLSVDVVGKVIGLNDFDKTVVAVKEDYENVGRKYGATKLLIALGVGSVGLIRELWQYYYAVVTANWNSPMRGVIYYNGVLKRFDDISTSEWYAFVDSFRTELVELGYDVAKIINKEDKYGLVALNLLDLKRSITHRRDAIKREVESDANTSITTFGFGCYNCIMADRCPFYKVGAKDCQILSNKLDNLDVDDMVDGILKFVIYEKTMRYLRGRIFEELDGGKLDKNTTDIEDSLVRAIELYLKLKYPERFRAGGKGSGDDVKEYLKALKKRLGT